MKKRLAIVLSLVVITVIVVSTFVSIEIYTPFSTAVASKKPFYVGVTYCGDSNTEAEQLINKVKNYTNLFALDSGPLMQNVGAMEQICTYAVNSGLNVIAYFSTAGASTNQIDSFLNFSQTGGIHFLGLYLNDEPGGKMLDGQVSLFDSDMGNNFLPQNVVKGQDGSISISEGNGSESGVTSSETTFEPSGTIKNDILNIQFPIGAQSSANTTYYLNGTITFVSTNGNVTTGTLMYQPDGTVQNQNGAIVTDEGNISQFKPYQELWNSNPILNYTDAANLYVTNQQSTLSRSGNQSSVNLFTSDYGLYWFDYLGGYNTVFAELFGAQTDPQTLALVRGAADMQDKSWGAMIEWANRTSITLQSGTQIYNEMRQAYEDGAEYTVVFNYSPSGNGTGLLQDEQFAAIQKFWTDVVQNPKITNNVAGQDALVLPNDYGWGMRSQTDTIWGIWPADNQSQQVWNNVQSALAKYGSKLIYNL